MSYAKVAAIAGTVQYGSWLLAGGFLLSAIALFYITMIG